MIPLWIFFAAGAGILSNVNGFLNRFVLLKDDDPTAYAWFSEVVRFGVFTVLIVGDLSIVFIARTIVFLVGLGLLEFVSVIVWMRMSAYAHLSVSTIIYRSRAIFVPVIAFIFLGEVLTVNQYIGIFIVFLGLSTVSTPRKIVKDKGIKYSYLSVGFVSFLTTLMKEVSSLASIPVLISFMSFPSVVLIPLLMKNAKKRLIGTFKKQLHLKLLASMANIVALYLQFVALKMGPVGQVNAIYQSMMVISVALGIIVLHERQDIKKKIIGSIIAVIGVIMLSF